jgi:hypothetical protein
LGVVLRGLCYCHDEPAVLNAFQTNQAAGKLLNLGGFAMHDEYFKTGVMVEMSVAGGNHQFMLSVLQVGQFVGHAMGVMVINERDSANDGGFGLGSFLRYEFVANEITECFGAIGITLVADVVIEALKEARIKCDADSA